MSHYCIVKAGLSKGLTAAMFIHAAGESSTGDVHPETRVVALQADEGRLQFLVQQLEVAGIQHTLIQEDGELMAIGICPRKDSEQIRRITSSFALVH